MSSPWVSALERVLKNVIFLAEVFADRQGEEIPRVPILELAKCFELATYERSR